MSLHVHRAERADTLVDALGSLLRTPLADPFTPEIVAVPTRGVERWIAQRLSHQLGVDRGGDGVCAGVTFPSLRQLTAVLRTDPSGAVASDPWSSGQAVWPLLQVIDDVRDQPWAALLWSYLGDNPTRAEGTTDLAGRPHRRARRWGTAQHLATLFARYAAVRPGMVSAWANGDDVGPEGGPLTSDQVWQARLWRALHARIGGPDPIARRHEATAELRRSGGPPDLPARVSVFGPTRIGTDQLDLLLALAGHRELHLWLPHPSPALWDAVDILVDAGNETGGNDSGPLTRTADPTAAVARHRLLGYLGRDVRELQVALRTARRAAPALEYPALEYFDDHHQPVEGTSPPPAYLLARLQRDLAADAAPRPTAERPLLAADDRSVTVHACHGPHRQVEVLREVLVGLLADDPGLQPRDIVVMCPDIETYAPLIAAAFGLAGDDDEAEHPGHRLRVRLADRTLRQLNPVLAVLERVLALADSRMSAADLLDLCAAPPVAARFGFSTDDLERLRELVVAAGVRWGLDPAHRQRYGMGDFTQNTWAAGLDRLLLGVAMDEADHGFIGTALPLDDVDSADVDLVGRLAEFLARLHRIVDDCAEEQPVAGWVALGREIVDLLTDVRQADRWQHTQAYAELARLADPAGTSDTASPLSLAEAAALLGDAFRGRGSRANFRTGSLTVATLLPMRAVPHRVVCLLGMDDGSFPRRVPLDGDDLSREPERLGDPDPRSEDRQLLLDAVLAAQERLVILYSGMDPRTGTSLPPAVPITALLDALDQTARTVDGAPVRQHLTVRHRLQPFDPDNFVPGALGSPAGLSFDPAGLRAVRASRRSPVKVPDPYAGLTLPPLPARHDLELAELVRFLAHPPRALLRQRALLSLGTAEKPEGEQIPVELAGLERWAVGDRLLREHLAGAGIDALTAAEWRRGTVPPRAFGQQVLAELGADVATLAGTAADLRQGPATRADLALDLGPVRLSGSVAGLYADVAVTVVYARLSARQRLRAWVELLALTIAYPERRWRSVVVGRGGRSSLGPVEPEFAATVLSDLVDLHGVGMCGPLPFAPRTSYEYALTRFRDRPFEQERARVAGVWKNERDDLWVHVLGPDASLEVLMADPSRPEEERGTLAEPSRFGTLARRVFHPLLSAGEPG